MKDNEKRRMMRTVKHVIQLINLDAPQILKADAFLRCIAPVAIREIGVNECARVLVDLMTRALSIQCYACTVCHKELDSTLDTSDAMLYCVKCKSDLDAMCKEYQYTPAERLMNDIMDFDVNMVDDETCDYLS